MKTVRKFSRAWRAAVVPAALAAALAVQGQTYLLNNWMVDPFCPDTNYVLSGAHSVNPSFTNNGIMRGSLYINSPIGATLTLANPGDAITFSGLVTLAGHVNPDGNMQFRFGLFLQGKNTGDTNWLGYLVGNPTGTGTSDTNGLYVRSNPNPGNYGSGSTGSTTWPDCEAVSYNREWTAGTYVFSLGVTQLSAEAQRISWKIAGVAPNTYLYAGVYTNTSASTTPPAFDQVGFLGGGALFNVSSVDDVISFNSLLVTYAPARHK